METLINMPRLGNGTMVMGIIHLVAPTASSCAEGISFGRTASLSDILRAIYYGVQNHANVII